MLFECGNLFCVFVPEIIKLDLIRRAGIVSRKVDPAVRCCERADKYNQIGWKLEIQSDVALL